MRPRVTDNKVIYVRFRKDLDALITEAAEAAKIAKATFVGRAMTEYMQKLTTACSGRFDAVTKDQLSLSSLSSSFFVKKGRADERSLGKPMRVTLKRFDESNMRLVAQYSGYSITQFRTAIIVSHLQQNNGI